jgi:hypothetical protein
MPERVIPFRNGAFTRFGLGRGFFMTMTKTQRTVKPSREPQINLAKIIAGSRWHPVFEFGQSGRFENLQVNEAGFCLLEKGGKTYMINLRESLEWYQEILNENWWGDSETKPEGLQVWFGLLVENLGGIAVADMGLVKRFFGREAA